MTMFWSDDVVEKLRRLWAEGLSAGDIAAQIPGTSRSSITGKARRLGLEERGSPVVKLYDDEGPLPHKTVRALHMRIHKLGLFNRPQEEIMEAFAFTETASVAQIARALSYQERQVEQALDRARRGFHRKTPAAAGCEGWQAE